MKYGVFVVDDEPLIVEGLRVSIERNMPDFYLAGSACSGETALEQILRIKPDIIISDIRMRGMDGLELARNLRQLLPFSKVIFLSGYDDFSYAQTAIRSQVFDYLLKPITDGLLHGVLMRAAEAISEQKKEKHRLDALMNHLDDGLPFLRHLLFSALRSPSPPETDPVLKLFNMQMDDSVYLPACVRFLEDGEAREKYDNDRQLLLFEQIRFIFRDFAVDVLPFYEQTTFILLMRFGRHKDAHSCESLAYTVLEKVATMISLNQKGTFCIGVGKLAQSRREIESAYSLAKEATRYCFFFGSGSIINYNDVNAYREEGSTNWEWLQQLILSIRAGAQETAFAQIKAHTDLLYKRMGTAYSVRRDYLHICMTLWQEFSRDYFSEHESEQLFCGFIGKLFACSDIHAAGDMLLQMVSEICQTISGRLLDRNKQIALQIEEIIERDYATATLETISSAIHMSPSYTSNLYSSTMGVTIRDTIINKRIDKAKELLRQTDMKLYEIADKVGYSDAKYFSQLLSG